MPTHLLAAALVVVVEVPEDVEADADVAAEDAVRVATLRVREAAAVAPGHGEVRRAVDQEERDAVRSGAAVLPLVEVRDETGAGWNGPIVEDRAGLLRDRVGELEVAGRDAGRRHWTILLTAAVGNLCRTRRRSSADRQARQAGGALDREVGIGDGLAREVLVDELRAAARLRSRHGGPARDHRQRREHDGPVSETSTPRRPWRVRPYPHARPAVTLCGPLNPGGFRSVRGRPASSPLRSRRTRAGAARARAGVSPCRYRSTRRRSRS